MKIDISNPNTDRLNSMNLITGNTPKKETIESNVANLRKDLVAGSGDSNKFNGSNFDEQLRRGIESNNMLLGKFSPENQMLTGIDGVSVNNENQSQDRRLGDSLSPLKKPVNGAEIIFEMSQIITGPGEKLSLPVNTYLKIRKDLHIFAESYRHAKKNSEFLHPSSTLQSIEECVSPLVPRENIKCEFALPNKKNQLSKFLTETNDSMFEGNKNKILQIKEKLLFLNTKFGVVESPRDCDTNLLINEALEEINLRNFGGPINNRFSGKNDRKLNPYGRVIGSQENFVLQSPSGNGNVAFPSFTNNSENHKTKIVESETATGTRVFTVDTEIDTPRKDVVIDQTPSRYDLEKCGSEYFDFILKLEKYSEAISVNEKPTIITINNIFKFPRRSQKKIKKNIRNLKSKKDYPDGAFISPTYSFKD
jgi:hypothetical protein